MVSLGQEQYKDSLLTHSTVVFFCVFMITGFQLDDKFAEETMACNRKQNGHWFLKRRGISRIRFIGRLGTRDKMEIICVSQSFCLYLGLTRAELKLL